MNLALENDTNQSIPIDHLADINTVLHGQRRVRTQIVLTRLAELNPTAYEGWSFSDLKTVLVKEGIEIGKSHGHSVIRAEDINRVFTQRHDQGNPTSGNDAGN